MRIHTKAGEGPALPIRTDAGMSADALPISSRDAAGEPLPIGGADAPARYAPPSPDRRAAAAAVLAHALLLAAAAFRLAPNEAPLPSTSAMSVTYVTVPGDPPPGDPAGDDAPPPATVPDAKPASSPDRPSTQGDAPAASEEAPPSKSPSPEPEKASSSPSPTQGDGSLALGARTLGSAQGLDPALMASVGQAVATRVRTCWAPPQTAPGGVSVRIVARFSPDGALSSPPQIVGGTEDAPTPVADPEQWQLDAAAAVARCSPISLPSFLYPYWREMEIQIYSTKS